MILNIISFLKVNKNQKAPFLMAGCKVADGAGTMLVRSSYFFLCFFYSDLPNPFEDLRANFYLEQMKF